MSNIQKSKRGGNIQKPNGVSGIKSMLENADIKARFNQVLGRRANQFMSSIISAVSADSKLAECEPMTVIQAALKAAVLDLPIEQNFGFAYLIPFKNNKAGITECQFQMGYKGYIQLALRTGLYKRINVVDVREGELVNFNPLTEELELDFIPDEKERLKAPVIGYAGYFSLLNGFEKMVYWSLDQLLAHGMKYSAQFRKFQNGMWVDQQDDMCRKTVIKNMITKWGILSVEMQQPNMQLLDALQADQAVIVDETEYKYLDNPDKEMIEGEIIEEEELITTEDRKRLFEIADAEMIKEVMVNFGYQDTHSITKDDYKKIVDEIFARLQEEEAKEETETEDDLPDVLKGEAEEVSEEAIED